MIIFSQESLGDIRGRDSESENIVDGLNMKGLLDLSIRSDEEMEKNQGRDGGKKEGD